MTTEIKVCMGSSCFAKGNPELLEFIKEYIAKNHLEAQVTTVGALCENKCSNAPRVIINEKEYVNVTKEQIKDVLDSYTKILNFN